MESNQLLNTHALHNKSICCTCKCICEGDGYNVSFMNCGECNESTCMDCYNSLPESDKWDDEITDEGCIWAWTCPGCENEM